jgi:hypothetical protein
MLQQVPEASLRRWKYLVDVGLWPRMVEFNWRGWLENFETGDLPFAVRLLDNFLYFSQPLTRQLFRSAFLGASELVVAKQPLAAARAQWAYFVDGLLVVRVSGEQPSSADSGYAFTRLARDDLQIDEAQLLEPGQAIDRLLNDHSGNVMFVDDFVGSGTQFVKTWTRRIDLPSGRGLTSFRDVAFRKAGCFRFFLCTAVATTYGVESIRQAAPEVTTLSGQTLDERASALNPNSLLWRNDMAESGPAFIRRVSELAGIPLADGEENEWHGFHGLGLSLAFSHAWPDATLPIYHWAQNGWTPLLVKGAV